MVLNTRKMLQLIGAFGLLAWVGSDARAQEWVTYSNETSVRMPTGSGLNDPATSTADVEEKDYAWGDVDHDGDIDLVVVRKQPFTSAGREPNVLFMNEGLAEGHSLNGVLIDRTDQYIPDFQDLTNDRDVAMADVDGDGWLDIITAPTYGSGLPQSISHPRIYMNQGDGGGSWGGFVYEPARIPAFPSHPNFCGVAAGDVTGEGDVDLYFTDYDRISDNTYDDRLLINDGFGFFNDQSTARMSGSMLESEFGISAVIADTNNDGWNDIVKNENGPVRTFNNGGDGFFDIQETTYGGAAYFFNLGYLDEQAPFINATLDMVISDDGTDRWLRNTGNGSNGMADYTSYLLPESTGGFGGNSLVVDLNNDGWNDMVITDVDVDISGCGRTTDILRNNGNPPVNTFTPNTGGIPSNMLTGVHDAAVFDVNGDGWVDIVFGRCIGTQVWINAPPVAMEFDYPQGLPETMVIPDQVTEVQVQLTPIGDTVAPGTARIHVAINGGAFVSAELTPLGDDLYTGTLPGADCLDDLDYYFTAELSGGLSFSDPPAAPAFTYTALAAAGSELFIDDTLEGDVSDWTVVSDPSLAGGEWEHADPNGTIFNSALAAPEDDATPDGIMAFVTDNGVIGGDAGGTDVDLGPTDLISPVFDIEGSDAFVSHAQWLYSATGTHDFITTAVSNDGGSNWVEVGLNAGTQSSWQTSSFLVSDYVEPTATVRVRFSVCDCPNDSVTEAGIDDFRVERILCSAGPCTGDLDGSGGVDAADLALLLGSWGPNPGAAADLNGDDSVDAADLALLLGGWGACP